MSIAHVLVTLLWVAALFFAIFQGVWVDEAIANRTLERMGFSDAEIIKTERYFVALRGCSGGDAAKFTVKAKNPVGKEVELYVCAGGLFKGATVRSD